MTFDIKSKAGIMLDIGCGNSKQKGFVGMDRRDMQGVDIVHDLESFPYPLEDEVCLTIIGSHIIEHIKPWLFLDVMNELWRIMKPEGNLALSMPYGTNFGYVQDPTHCNPCNEATWSYFDPEHQLFWIYEPRPWKIMKGFPVWQSGGNLEVVLSKRNMKEAEEIKSKLLEDLGGAKHG